MKVAALERTPPILLPVRTDGALICWRLRNSLHLWRDYNRLLEDWHCLPCAALLRWLSARGGLVLVVAVKGSRDHTPCGSVSLERTMDLLLLPRMWRALARPRMCGSVVDATPI